MIEVATVCLLVLISAYLLVKHVRDVLKSGTCQGCLKIARQTRLTRKLARSIRGKS